MPEPTPARRSLRDRVLLVVAAIVILYAGGALVVLTGLENRVPNLVRPALAFLAAVSIWYAVRDYRHYRRELARVQKLADDAAHDSAIF